MILIDGLLLLKVDEKIFSFYLDRQIKNEETIVLVVKNGDDEKFVVKAIRDNSSSYLKLQQHSYIQMRDSLNYRFDSKLGKMIGREGEILYDVLIMPYFDDLLTLDKAFKNRKFLNEDIVVKLAKVIYGLHKNKISGFDTEFYWSEKKNNIVLLDIGLPYTFDVTACEMIERQLYCVKDNEEGRNFLINHC